MITQKDSRLPNASGFVLSAFLMIVVLALPPFAQAEGPITDRVSDEVPGPGIRRADDDQGSIEDRAVSLFRFNPDSVQRSWPEDRSVYLGIKERDQNSIEMLGLKVLLGDSKDGLVCGRLLEHPADSDSINPESRVQRIHDLARWIEDSARLPEFRDQYLSYFGAGGHVDPDFLIYTSPHSNVARLYGEVIFEIREKVPRGVDLNRLNRLEYDYYEKLGWADQLNPKRILIREILDRDEYVIPSHVPHDEVESVTIRARLPKAFHAGLARLTGRVQRRYRRGSSGVSTWVDMTDRNGKFMARICFEEDRQTIPVPEQPESTSAIPLAVRDAIESLEVEGKSVRIAYSAS